MQNQLAVGRVNTTKPYPKKNMDLELWDGKPAETDEDTAQENAPEE